MIYEKKLREIIYENFNIIQCSILGQTRRGKDAFFTTKGKPRMTNGFYYLCGCDCLYKANGRELYAERGDVVYLPPFCEYESYYCNYRDEDIDGILINMLFCDENSKEFYLPNSLRVCSVKGNENVKRYFTSILDLGNQPIKKMAEIKSVAYKILSYFGTYDKTDKLNKSKYKDISKGIMYLENDIKQELTIEDIAKMCNMSSSYFRRIFKEYSGMSPIQFRIRKKLDMAKELLLNDAMSIYEISEYLGFENVTYFTRLFKEYEGITPKKYKTSVSE